MSLTTGLDSANLLLVTETTRRDDMNKLDTIELWKLLTLTRREYGHTHELTLKIQKEIIRRMKA